tara:strand:+ start:7 stop:177 length:171 start_codon:yes stop_codon:yes gene_type:complete
VQTCGQPCCPSGFPYGEQLVAKIHSFHQLEIYGKVNFGSTLKRTDKIRKNYRSWYE